MNDETKNALAEFAGAVAQLASVTLADRPELSATLNRTKRAAVALEELLSTPRILTEDEARAAKTCCGCGKPKDSTSGLVCWRCFKSRTDIEPLKHFGGTFEEWQRIALGVTNPKSTNP